jgi:hypothetical protein
MTPLARAAVKLGEKGLRVFPCWPRTKKPAIKENLRCAAIGEAIISKWWGDQGQYNVAIATGRASGVWVLDVDNDDNGKATLSELEAKFGPLPPTVEVITADGRHLYFRWPDSGVEIRNFQQRDDLPGLDVRGEGGYVLAPPSVHPSGRRYEWSVDSADTFADAPEWLLDIITSKRRSSGGVEPRPPGTWRFLIDAEHEGSRRGSAVARLYGYLVRRYVEPMLALRIVYMFDELRNKPPLGHGEVRRIADDIANREADRRESRR